MKRTSVPPTSTSAPLRSRPSRLASADAFAVTSSVRSSSSVRRHSLPRLEQLLDPVARWVDLEPVARVRRDECAAPTVLGDAEVIVHRAAEHRFVLVLVQRDAEVVDPRQAPVTGLDDDVDRAPLELGQPELEPPAVELLPGDACLDRHVLVVDPPVAGHQMEAELADVPRLDVDDLGGHEVVVEEAHGKSSSLPGGAVAVASRSVEPRAAAGAPDGARRLPVPAADADARPERPTGLQPGGR